MLCGEAFGGAQGVIIFPWRAWHTNDMKVTALLHSSTTRTRTENNMVVNLEFLMFSVIVTWKISSQQRWS